MRLLPREFEHVVREPLVEDRAEMVLALVELDGAVGDELGGLLVDRLGDEPVLVSAHWEHWHRDMAS